MKLTFSFLLILTFTVLAYSQTATLRGRTTTANGKAIRNAIVTMTDATTGEQRTTITNLFGYFNFANIVLNRGYTFDTRHKKFTFFNVGTAFSNSTSSLSLIGQ